MDTNVYAYDENGIYEKVIGVIVGGEGEERFKNTIQAYIAGILPIEVKTNLTQTQWARFCEGELSDLELRKYA